MICQAITANGVDNSETCLNTVCMHFAAKLRCKLTNVSGREDLQRLRM